MDRGWSGGSYSTAGDNCCILSHQVRIPFSPFFLFSFGFSPPFFPFFPRKIKQTLLKPAPCKESETVLDSGIQTVESGLQVLDSSLCQRNLDSGFQSLVGFRIP